MKIILIRHGETNWNLEQKYQGYQDIPLNETGRKQACILADRLKGEDIEAIYCSDLIRSRETAAIIAEYRHLPVQIDSRLREMSFGEWEGLTFKEVYDKYPREFEDWYNNTGTFKVPGGESVSDLLQRVWPVLLEISQIYKGTVLVSTHGGVLRAVLYHLQGEKEVLWREGLGNGAVFQILISGGQARVLD